MPLQGVVHCHPYACFAGEGSLSMEVCKAVCAAIADDHELAVDECPVVNSDVADD